MSASERQTKHALTVLEPAPRKFYCAECGRYLTETTAREGTIRVKCEYCRKWRIVDIARNMIR